MSKWRSIKINPPEDEWILVVYNGKISFGIFNESEGGYNVTDLEFPFYLRSGFEVTHWKLLPKLPKLKT